MKTLAMDKFFLAAALGAGLLTAPLLSRADFNSVAAPWVGKSFSGNPCQQPGGQGFGPFDYTDPAARLKHLPIVEEYHFNKDIQLLIKGKTGYLVDELQYTLNSFPNHHQALKAVEYFPIVKKLEIDKGATKGLPTPVECYYQRAIHFAPDDFIAHILYANFLSRNKRFDKADNIYTDAIKRAPKELKLKYSYGLFLVDMKRYDEAMKQAREVYKKNYPRKKLKEKLIASGHWTQ